MVNVEKFTIDPVVMEKNGQELLKHLHMLYLFEGSSPFFCLILFLSWKDATNHTDVESTPSFTSKILHIKAHYTSLFT